jgi:hypothetical protein
MAASNRRSVKRVPRLSAILIAAEVAVAAVQTNVDQRMVVSHCAFLKHH